MVLEHLIKNSQIIIIEGERKTAKLTFILFAIKNLLEKKATILTPIEKHLFKRKMRVIQDRFDSLSDINEHLEMYILKEEWNTLKKRYSYDFFREELKKIFQETDADVVILHRFGAFFEFQDRFEIEPMFRMLIQVATEHNKKVIFSLSTSSVNYDFIHNIMSDFSDLTLQMQETNLNERSIQVMDSLQSITSAEFRFRDAGNNLAIESDSNDVKETEVEFHRVLLVTYDRKKNSSLELVKYLLSGRKHFQVTSVSSIHEVIQEIFLEPDLLFFFIDREDFIDDVFKNLKLKLPRSRFFVFFPQNFIRAIDRRTLYEIGIDDVFGSEFQFDDLVVSIEKTLKRHFYNESLTNVSFSTQYFKSKKELHHMMSEAEKNNFYFSLFTFHYQQANQETIALGRENDFIYYDENEMKLYYVALNAREFIAEKVAYTLTQKGCEVKLLESCNVIQLEKCLEM